MTAYTPGPWLEARDVQEREKAERNRRAKMYPDLLEALKDINLTVTLEHRATVFSKANLVSRLDIARDRARAAIEQAKGDS